jgi:hypothetical protein
MKLITNQTSVDTVLRSCSDDEDKMKISEIIESREETNTKIQLMLKRAKKRNPKFGKAPHPHAMRGAEDSFTGYSLDTFAQTTWK